MTTNPIDIISFLPHRKPMLMVDFINEIGDGKVITSFKINDGNIFLQGNRFLEIGLIENMAQTCSAILGQEIIERGNAKTKIIGFITNIKKISIFRSVNKSDVIITKARLVSRFGEICNIESKTYCKGELIAEAEINLFIKEQES